MSRRWLALFFALGLPGAGMLAMACSGPPRPKAPGAFPSGPEAAVPIRQVAGIDMLSPHLGVGLTTTLVLSCRPLGGLGGCTSSGTARPLDLVWTDNGGRSWRASGLVPGVSGEPKAGLSAALAFSSRHDGYVAVGGSLFSTTDGGRDWRKMRVGGVVESLIPTGRTAWLVIRACLVSPPEACPTELVAARIGGGLSRVRSVPAVGVDLVGAPAAGTAVFAGGGDRHGSTLVMTFDGGSTWVDAPDPCGQLGTVSLVGESSRQWWLVCVQDGGMNQGTVEVLGSSDAGSSWTMEAMANEEGQRTGGLSDSVPQGVAISPNGARLWLIGLNAVQTSTDGGRDWSDVPGVNLGGGLSTIDTVGPERAWITAWSQGMWSTADGQSWSALGPTGLSR